MRYQTPVDEMPLNRLIKDPSCYEPSYSQFTRRATIQTPLSQITHNAYSSIFSGRCSPLAGVTDVTYYRILELVNPINILSTFLEDMDNRQGQECEQALAMFKGLNLGGLNLASAALDLLIDNAQGEALGEPKIEETEQIAVPSDGNNDNDQ